MHTLLPERKIRPRTAAVALAGDNGRVIRPADAGDFPFLRAMLFEAAHWRAGVPRPATEETFAHPALDRYVEGWGRDGDAGVVAVEAEVALARPGTASFRPTAPATASSTSGGPS